MNIAHTLKFDALEAKFILNGKFPVKPSLDVDRFAKMATAPGVTYRRQGDDVHFHAIYPGYITRDNAERRIAQLITLIRSNLRAV